tara:strand:- start:24 stop:206 length:183 start_codon:yes stop_codon:yes gene_type:complete
MKNKTLLERATNKWFSQNDQQFFVCCAGAGIKPTARQASKFRNEKGKAYKQVGKGLKPLR